MAEKLSLAFDGWTHYLLPGEDFVTDSRQLIASVGAADDDLSDPFELGAPEVRYKDDLPPSELPFAAEQRCWGGVAICLQALSEILGGKGRAYQHNQYDTNGVKGLSEVVFTFAFEPGADGFQEGRV